jgi:hypothetical protein
MVGLQMATDIYDTIFNKKLLFLTKLEFLITFNSDYAQYYSYIELVFIFNRDSFFLAYVTTSFSVIENDFFVNNNVVC